MQLLEENSKQPTIPPLRSSVLLAVQEECPRNEWYAQRGRELRAAGWRLRKQKPNWNATSALIEKVEKPTNNMNIYIFFRDDMFYPIELKDDASAKRNAEINPGTLKVENAVTREVVWTANGPS